LPLIFNPIDLPYGWTRKENEDGSVVFVQDGTGKETTTDPRLAFSQEPKDSLYDFKQRFDGSTTALQVIHGTDLSAKTALITGANVGIGFETARTLALHGCEVIFACRSKESAEAAIQTITDEKSTAKCSFVHLDLCSLESVKLCANELKLKYR
jgi:WW domain-containing oxidoreductase